MTKIVEGGCMILDDKKIAILTFLVALLIGLFILIIQIKAMNSCHNCVLVGGLVW